MFETTLYTPWSVITSSCSRPLLHHLQRYDSTSILSVPFVPCGLHPLTPGFETCFKHCLLRLRQAGHNCQKQQLPRTIDRELFSVDESRRRNQLHPQKYLKGATQSGR